jgi:hypothetical protein
VVAKEIVNFWVDDALLDSDSLSSRTVCNAYISLAALEVLNGEGGVCENPTNAEWF